MALAAYFQPSFMLNHLGAKGVNMSTDTFEVGLIATGTLATRSTSEGYEYVSQLLANNGSALAEVSGGGYSRQALTSVSWTNSGLVGTFTAANPAWSSATFSTVYGWIHDETDSSTTDATRPLLAIFDFGGSQSVSSATFTLDVNGSGLVTFTAAV